MGTAVDNEPVQERATLSNEKKNEIAVNRFRRCIVPARQVFQSLLGLDFQNWSIVYFGVDKSPSFSTCSFGTNIIIAPLSAKLTLHHLFELFAV